jgi:hypothetical protein
MSTFNEEHLLEFVTDLSARLHEGAKTYGTRSFSRDPSELIREVREELIDVCGWSFVLSERLRALETALASLPKQTATAPVIEIRRPTRPVESRSDAPEPPPDIPGEVAS